jgi:hypothetical protein
MRDPPVSRRFLRQARLSACSFRVAATRRFDSAVLIAPLSERRCRRPRVSERRCPNAPTLLSGRLHAGRPRAACARAAIHTSPSKPPTPPSTPSGRRHHRLRPVSRGAVYTVSSTASSTPHARAGLSGARPWAAHAAQAEAEPGQAGPRAHCAGRRRRDCATGPRRIRPSDN